MVAAPSGRNGLPGRQSHLPAGTGPADTRRSRGHARLFDADRQPAGGRDGGVLHPPVPALPLSAPFSRGAVPLPFLPHPLCGSCPGESGDGNGEERPHADDRDAEHSRGSRVLRHGAGARCPLSPHASVLASAAGLFGQCAGLPGGKNPAEDDGEHDVF